RIGRLLRPGPPDQAVQALPRRHPGPVREPLNPRPIIARMASGTSTDVAARAALVAGAAALAHGDDLALGLRTLLDAVARPLGVASAAIVIRDGSGTGLE